jgi:predicted phage gp36 major capsid-like protein
VTGALPSGGVSRHDLDAFRAELRRDLDAFRAELRRDLDDARAWIGRVDERVNRIDEHGSRNAGVIAARVSGQAGDIAEIKAEFRAHLGEHRRQQEAVEARLARAAEAAEENRRQARRWMIATVFTAAGVAAAWGSLLWEMSRHVAGR